MFRYKYYNTGEKNVKALYHSQNFVNQSLEGVVDPGGGFHNFLVAQLLGQNTGSHVGDTADTHHVHAAVSGNQRLGNRGHAHGISAQDSAHPDLRGGFVVGAGVHGINALLQRDAVFRGLFLDGLAQRGGVQIGHIREPGAEGIQVGPDQRIGTGEVDVIGDQHQIAGTERKIYTAAGVGQYQCFHTQSSQNPDRQGDFLLRESFVIMNSSLQDHNGLVSFPSKDQGTAVTGYCRYGKIGNLRIRDADGVVQGIGIVTQTAAQNQTDFRTQCCTGFDEFSGPQDFSVSSMGSPPDVVDIRILPRGRKKDKEKPPVAVTAPGVSAKGFGKKRGRKEDLRSWKGLRLTASVTFLLLRYFLVLNIE